ncbi:Acetyltransferase (GNAT) family protein [Microbacterium sp. ru370.1]|uniref:GNAT family N-acetyltransferase n=1 Tax=unclassified Microbacterium TaxID=2609290 RepID=UPI00087E5E26|nr:MULTISPECIES: GNAT family N-acetyltransferase [unclassified Microbacterium]SDO58218.1 Acetyltransferase (GNAT) family protein [Microbacterium sp. ru370.1]SIT85712.1 Acetyltransferase (GNAT) family protein [Microbacterium sp. RU1D]
MPGLPIRAALASDGAFLADMTVEAANWRAGGSRPRHEVLSSPDHRRYIAGWQRPGDAGFIAESPTGEAIGAAWYRMLPRDEPGFGWVGTGVPELIIGVRPVWRSHGTGRALLQRLVDHARGEGYARISLSVERDNFAVSLYRSEGFAVVRRGIGRDVLVKRLG